MTICAQHRITSFRFINYDRFYDLITLQLYEIEWRLKKKTNIIRYTTAIRIVIVVLSSQTHSRQRNNNTRYNSSGLEENTYCLSNLLSNLSRKHFSISYCTHSVTGRTIRARAKKKKAFSRVLYTYYVLIVP